MAYTISSDSSVGITLTNASYSPLSANANVTVANGTALAAIGNGGNYTWTIDNSGTITGGGAGNAGIVLGGSADLVAHGDMTNEAVGIITGDTFGVAIYGPGSITSMSSVTVPGSLDNTGSTLEVGTGTELGAVTLVDTAIISNGTIIDDGNDFVFDGGTFSGLTFLGPLNLANYGDQLNIANGLTMAGDGNISLTGGSDTILITEPST